jgi:acyl-CoA thioesterase FadM
VKVRIEYRMLDAGDETVLAEGHTVHACTNADLRPRRFPQEVARAFRDAVEPARGE